MKFSNFEQGTKEWFEDRKKRITSSDAAIINGTNTFNGNSPFKLWQEKLELIDKEELNHAMIEGNLLEEEARNWFNTNYSTNFIKPPGAYHDNEKWAMASLDGYDKNDENILEIKCGVNTYDKATKRLVPSYYFDQIQHLLFVSGKQKCFYLVYRPDKDPIVISIPRQEYHIKSLIEKEKEFYEYLTKKIPPPLLEKEFVEIRDPKATDCAKKWRETKEKLHIAQEMEKIALEELKNQTDGGNCIFPDAGVKVELRTRKGNINYNAILKENNISDDLIEKYRKPDLSWLQPIIIKQA